MASLPLLLLAFALPCLVRADCASNVGGEAEEPTLLHSWVTLEYEWHSPNHRAQYVADGLYIPENNALTGLKVWRDELYVTVSRWRPGVPSTLNKVVAVGGKSLLQPFPNWEMQEIGNPNALQYVQSMEIDSRGWMWIIDVGRLNLLSDSKNFVRRAALTCTHNLQVSYTPKLIIWDIANGCTVRTFVFPNKVLPWKNSFANDIVVDESAGFAYISNTWAEGGIIVYDFNRNLARRFDHPSMKGVPSQLIRSYPIGFPSDGIALSHDAKTVYYAALSSPHRYSIPTSALQDFTLSSEDIGEDVKDLGVATFTDGMTFSDDGRLIYGDYVHGAVYAWDVKKPIPTQSRIAGNNSTMQWPDTFAWDESGNLLFTSNKLHLYIFGGMQFDGSDGDNWRIWSVHVGAKSYLSKKPIPSRGQPQCEATN